MTGLAGHPVTPLFTRRRLKANSGRGTESPSQARRPNRQLTRQLQKQHEPPSHWDLVFRVSSFVTRAGCHVHGFVWTCLHADRK